MHVLGISNADPKTADPSWVCATTNPSLRVPRITCAKASSVQLIMYDRPRPKGMQYISLNPIPLALGDHVAGLQHTKVQGIDSAEEEQEKEAQESRRKLVEKLRQHTIVKRVPSARDKALPKIVNQVNWSWELEQVLQKNVGRLGPRPKRSLSVSEQFVESATVMRNYVVMQLLEFFTLYLFPVIRKAFILLLLGHRMLAELLLILLEFRIKPGGRALKDVSATAQQIEIRLQQFCYWPMQYVTLRKRKGNWASINTSHPDYIRFYNSLWLVANDVIIGLALGSYIIEHADWVAARVNDLLRTYSIEALQRSISWLMGWPAGLKLNGELAAFLGDLFLWVIDYWSSECAPSLTIEIRANRLRLRLCPGSGITKDRLVRRLLILCRRQHAHCHAVRLPLRPHRPHLLILPCLCAHLPLAADNPAIPLPPLPWQEAQRPPQPYRLMRLRS